MDGLLLIDKPSGWSSFDVVAKIRGALRHSTKQKPSSIFHLPSSPLPKVKVGHAGTLDPLATGLMLVLIGNYTKRAEEFSKLDKTYDVTMKLGITSTTGDEEGEKTPYDMHQPACFAAEPQIPQASSDSEHFSSSQHNRRTICTPSCVVRRENAHNHEVQAVELCDCHAPTEIELQTVVEQFIGEVMQTPHKYSAIKINGQRAYKLARAGKEVKIEPRKVHIYEIKVNDYSYPEIRFSTQVSSGTYIRSLVEDIGILLETGAYMSRLRRTKVGNYTIEQSISPSDITAEQIYEHLVVA